MIVTEEGKNIYPEDSESRFRKSCRQEFCVFAAKLHLAKRRWPTKNLCSYSISSRDNSYSEELPARHQRAEQSPAKLQAIQGLFCWDEDFPGQLSLKIKRNVLAELSRS